MENEDLTMEQLKELLDKQTKQLEDLTAERDSLAEERTQNLETLESLKSELSETKKVNYTLARSLDVSGKKETDEEILHKLYSGRRH